MTRKKLLKTITQQAGKSITSKNLRIVSQCKYGKLDVCTKGDLVSEKVIVEGIKKYFPADKILSEETESDSKIKETTDYLWVIDPIDGTANYIRGMKYCAVSVALTLKKQVVLAAVFNPFTNEFFFAEKGQGAFLNDKKISVSKINQIEKAFLATDNYYDQQTLKENVQLMLKLKKIGKLQIKGSAAMAICEVAAGRLELYFHTKLKPWDSAGAFLIAQEAGAEISNLRGEPIDFYSPEVLVANPKIHQAFIKAIF